jgi:dTDP-4-dehydrorhamnose 3,5-epimerase
MRFTPTPLAGSYLIDLDKREDERGFFARVFCAREFGEAELETGLVQMNISVSRDRGTLRGMHYQLEPSAEVKVVRALRGALWEVILDLRPASPTFGRSFGTELTAENRRMMYVPRGFAQGILTLEPDTEALYLVSTCYDPGRERGVRWNDPRFSISWPEEPSVISEKDAGQRDFDPAWHLGS